MRRRPLAVIVAAVLAAGAGLSGTVRAAGPPPSPIVDEPVAFTVTNRNTSVVPCSADGARYVISGHLIGPGSAVNGPGMRSTTLYLHGLGFGEWFWHFTAVGGYDYATAEALAGHTSIVIDRLGYGASEHPLGSATCLGAQASVAHQIIQQLRAGSYRTPSGPGPRFARVALAGHSAGGAIAEIEAYSFRDVNALIVMSYADVGASPAALTQFVRSGQVCFGGGQAAGPGQPRGYAYFGQSAGDFRAVMFHNTDPNVVTAATAMRNRDPCGDIDSFPQGIGTDVLRVPAITVPVLLVFGTADALFPPPAAASARALFRGTTDVTSVQLPDTGHALTLERTAAQTQTDVSRWLQARGY